MLNPFHQNGHFTNMQNPTTGNYTTPSFATARPVSQDQSHQNGAIPMQQTMTMTSQTMPVSTYSYGQQQQSSLYTNAKNQVPSQHESYQQVQSQHPNNHLHPTQATQHNHSTQNASGPANIYIGNPNQPKAKDSPFPHDNRVQHQQETPPTTYDTSRMENKKDESRKTASKNSGTVKQYQEGKNYDLRDAIQQIEVE